MWHLLDRVIRSECKHRQYHSPLSKQSLLNICLSKYMSNKWSSIHGGHMSLPTALCETCLTYYLWHVQCFYALRFKSLSSNLLSVMHAIWVLVSRSSRTPAWVPHVWLLYVTCTMLLCVKSLSSGLLSVMSDNNPWTLHNVWVPAMGNIACI